MHAHWVIPNGVTAALAAGERPLVVSLHGSDVFVARSIESRDEPRGRCFAARPDSACSDDLRRRAALGAAPDRTETLPYGVDTLRFTPSSDVRLAVRRSMDLGDAPVVFGAGRLVRKKGFEFLIDAVRDLRSIFPSIRLLLAGDGDLREELEARAAPLGTSVTFLGNQNQDRVGQLAAAADVVVVPSVHDVEGNVDGLPNFALEAMATATPLVATTAGGRPVIEDGVTGRFVLSVMRRAGAAIHDSQRFGRGQAPRRPARSRAEGFLSVMVLSDGRAYNATQATCPKLVGVTRLFGIRVRDVDCDFWPMRSMFDRVTLAHNKRHLSR
jgi:glycosyltransferase involved in cell wall biosynthesis